MDPNLQAAEAALQTEVTNATTVSASALALINGIAARVAAAVAAAVAASGGGITPADLQPITDVVTSLKASDDALAAAVTQNTPAAAPAARKG